MRSATRLTNEQVKHAVQRIQDGVDTEENFRLIFERYYPLVERYFMKRVGSVEDCLDLAQETFLTIYRAIHGFRKEAEFGTWVYCIARSVYCSWLGKRDRSKGFKEVALEVPASDMGGMVRAQEKITIANDGASPLDELLDKERGTSLRTAVGTLRGKQRACVELRIYQGFSYKQIASALQININTVKSHLFSAKTSLARRLGGAEGSKAEAVDRSAEGTSHAG